MLFPCINGERFQYRRRNPFVDSSQIRFLQAGFQHLDKIICVVIHVFLVVILFKRFHILVHPFHQQRIEVEVDQQLAVIHAE